MNTIKRPLLKVKVGRHKIIIIISVGDAVIIHRRIRTAPGPRLVGGVIILIITVIFQTRLAAPLVALVLAQVKHHGLGLRRQR